MSMTMTTGMAQGGISHVADPDLAQISVMVTTSRGPL